MPVSKSRNVCGYVKRVRTMQAIQAHIERRESALRDALAPQRRRLDVLKAEANVIFGRMTGAQIAEARRLTMAPPKALRGEPMVPA